MTGHEEAPREVLRAQIDRVFEEVYFCDEPKRVATTLEILDEADEAAHMRMGLSAALTGPDSATSIVEMTTHLAVADLRLRVQAHLDKLQSDRAEASAQSVREAAHAAMKASIQLLYVAEPPEFLDANGVDRPLEERHADLLASWLLGEGWHK